MSKTVLGIVGSYRKGGVIDTLVTEALEGAKEAGATTEKIYLIDQHIEFCRNCRHCTQEEGLEPGNCVHDDDMACILAKWKDSDALVIGAPVNFYNVTAVTRKFMERLVCFAYWPWGQAAPKMRKIAKEKKAIIITSSAMPSLVGRFFTGALRALKITAETMGAKVVASLFVGMISQEEKPRISESHLKKAKETGYALIN